MGPAFTAICLLTRESFCQAGGSRFRRTWFLTGFVTGILSIYRYGQHVISGPRSRSGVPLDEQSALPSAPGVPWWGAVLIAVGMTCVGSIIVVAGGDSTLGFAFKALYFIGCVAAVLAVRRRALFTAVAQPPLVLFGVAVITLYFLVSDTDSGIKKLVFNVALPVAKLFPLMGWTFAAVFAIGAARFWFTHPKNTGKSGSGGSGRRAAAKKSPAKKAAPDSGARPTRRNGSTPKPSMVTEDASTTRLTTRPRAGQSPRSGRSVDPRPKRPDAGHPERVNDVPIPPPRRRRAAPEAPEARRRHAGSYEDLLPGARAYRHPDNGYEPTPRLRHRDLH